jgi:hypothetical protein
VICFSLQLPEVNFFRHENLGQQTWVFSGIVDDTQRVEYSLLNGKMVEAGPEQSGVDISSHYLRDLLSLNTITLRFLTCQELQNHYICDVP